MNKVKLNRLTLDYAIKMIRKMISFSEMNHILPGSFAVVDEGGHLIALETRDGRLAATVDIAIDKAWTAATMKASGRMLEVISRGQGWRLNVKHKGRLTIIPGTIPVIYGRNIIGGIGHSGGSAEEDLLITQAGLAALYDGEENPPIYNGEKIDGFGINLARKLSSKAIDYIMSEGYPHASIAVVDRWGELIALYRMDNAPIGTVELARDKAWTAAVFETESEDIIRFGNKDLPNYGLNPVNWNERLTPIPGGIPIKIDGEVVGALGIASIEPDKDKHVAIEILKEI